MTHRELQLDYSLYLEQLRKQVANGWEKLKQFHPTLSKFGTYGEFASGVTLDTIQRSEMDTYQYIVRLAHSDDTLTPLLIILYGDKLRPIIGMICRYYPQSVLKHDSWGIILEKFAIVMMAPGAADLKPSEVFKRTRNKCTTSVRRHTEETSGKAFRKYATLKRLIAIEDAKSRIDPNGE